MPRALPRETSAPIMLPLCEAAKMRPTGRSASANAALAVSSTLSRRLTTPRLDGPTMRMPVCAQMSLSRASRASPSATRLGEAVGQHRATATPARAAVLDRGDRTFGRRHDVGVIGHFRQRGDRRPRALAQHFVSRRALTG